MAGLVPAIYVLQCARKSWMARGSPRAGRARPGGPGQARAWRGRVRSTPMNLGFFTMPIHPLEKDWRVSLREDREAFILADELGFTEGYVGEHATDQAENITSCAMFIATLAEATKRIRLGTAGVNMPNSHPAAVA